MSTPFRLRTLLAAVAFVGFAALPLFASTGKSELLDRNGNFFRLRSVTYAEAAPGGTIADAETPVLVLDVTTNGQTVSQIVPRSLGWEWDTESRLFLEPSSGTVYVLWVLKGWGSDEVRLSVFQNGTFTAEHRLSGGAMAGRKNLDATLNPQVIAPVSTSAVTSVAIQIRQVLQLVWWESFPWGGGGPRYVPVFLKTDGTVETESALVYDPTEGLFEGSSCEMAYPDAAYYPTVTRESISLARLSVFSPAVCKFLIIPVSFTWQNGDGGSDPAGQARHIPFIGVTVSLERNDDVTMAATSSRFDTGGTFETGYQSALSWAEVGTFKYQMYQAGPVGSRWGEIHEIPLAGSMTIDKARSLVRSLLENR
jgi:hypothetical protein